MTPAAPGIVILRDRIAVEELSRLVKLYFEDMVKYVVDVERRVIAIGGELQADAEQILMEDGSRQQDVWGANYYPGAGAAQCIEFTALINIRPARGNRSMEVSDLGVRERIRSITFDLIGAGEKLP